MKASQLSQLVAVLALAMASSAFAADTPAAPKPVDKASAKPTSGDVKKDVEKFNAQRDAMLAERQALLTQLKSATEAQRKAILEKMKELGDSQRELSKQIRDDLRKFRQSQGSPGRG